MNRLLDFRLDETRWQAQEHGVTDAPRDHGDAVLGRALRTLPSSRPPVDFAADVARAAACAGLAAGFTHPGERLLMKALGITMGAGLAGCTLAYGEAWIAAIALALGEGALRWGLLGGACLAISGLPWRHRLAFAGRAPAMQRD
ncbi:hypothetical protein [Luteimonas sp. 100069]|uniref:hypothetical protein n=1 Tax=Luteimonas sp. 100069 TaxID=2006109 RepID=UPI000F4E669E|nr:hypothetical protein [Luteimonas sp. 100069]RPD84045.1 hypothetical protein EGK76_13180 [Luteimonas sp. 100069]